MRKSKMASYIFTQYGSWTVIPFFTIIVLFSLTSHNGFTQETTQKSYEDWVMRCETPAGAQSQQCALIQYVTAVDRPNVGLTVIVLKTADQKARLLRVITPLGVLLPSGLGLYIDQEDVGRAGFVRCFTHGCMAEVIMEDELLNKLKLGRQATFIVFQTPEEGIGIPISLTGFSAGYDALP